MNWKGKVSKVSERDWGTKTIYSWQLEGANTWFRAEEDLKVQLGEWISFDGDSAQKITAVEYVQEAEVKQAAEAGAGGSGTTIGGAGEAPPVNSAEYWRWKQMRDLYLEDAYNYRAARSDAVRVVCAALDNGVLALGNAQGKKLGLVKGYVTEITRELLEDLPNE